MLGNPLPRCDRQCVEQTAAAVPITALLEEDEGPLVPAAGRFEPGVAFGQLQSPAGLLFPLGPLLLLTNLMPPPDRLDLRGTAAVQIGGQLNPSLLVVPQLDDPGRRVLAKPSKVVPRTLMKAGLDDLGPE